MRWEYLILKVTSGMLDSDEPLAKSAEGGSVGIENLPAAMNAFGEEGWEAFDTNISKGHLTEKVFFKRPRGA
jgi:hypothetical protein